MTRKHIVIVDGAWVGHHPAYVKSFTRILLEAGCQVSVLCPSPEDMKTWFTETLLLEAASFNAYYFSDKDVQPLKLIPGRLSSPLMCLARWLHLRNTWKKTVPLSGKPDMLFFAWMDIYLNRYLPARLIDRLFPFVWSGLYFQPRNCFPENSPQHPLIRIFSPVSMLAKSRHVCSLAVLDAGSIPKLRPLLLEKPVFVFPDFTDETPPCENFPLIGEIRSRARNRKIVGLIGSIERRKGLLTLLEIARQPIAQDWFFVFAGVLAEQSFSEVELREIESFIDERRENCFTHFERIPDDAKFNALVDSCDVIFAAYQGFPHSSNLVTKAANFGKGLIVSAGGYMEEVVRRYNLGEVVPEGDIHAAIASLSRLTACGSAPRRAGMREYSIAQSQERLRQSLLGLVANCVGSVTDGTDEKILAASLDNG